MGKKQKKDWDINRASGGSVTDENWSMQVSPHCLPVKPPEAGRWLA